jgi:hypothetical protein
VRREQRVDGAVGLLLPRGEHAREAHRDARVAVAQPVEGVALEAEHADRTARRRRRRAQLAGEGGHLADGGARRERRDVPRRRVAAGTDGDVDAPVEQEGDVAARLELGDEVRAVAQRADRAGRPHRRERRVVEAGQERDLAQERGHALARAGRRGAGYSRHVCTRCATRRSTPR